MLPPHAPIASRTRAKTHAISAFASANAYTALAWDNDDDDDPSEADDTGDDTLPLAPHMANAVVDPDTGRELTPRQLRQHPKLKKIWDTSYANELGCLCQGIGQDPSTPSSQHVTGTNTFRPIKFRDIPADRRKDVTYPRVVCDVRPQKADPNRTRITVGGNRISYPGDTGTKTGSVELVKLLINSVLSRPGANFACFDIKNFYLGTPLAPAS